MQLFRSSVAERSWEHHLGGVSVREVAEEAAEATAAVVVQIPGLAQSGGYSAFKLQLLAGLLDAYSSKQVTCCISQCLLHAAWPPVQE